MRRVLVAASLLLALPPVHADQAGARRDPLPFNQCLRTDRINDWHVLGDRQVIVRNGPDRFLVTTSVACPRIGFGGGLHFRPVPSNDVIGPFRICGDINEQILRRDEPPCPIASVQQIDKATYQRLSSKATRHGSGAEPNGPSRP